ncbi:MAG: DUF5658 family protein [Phycisphaerales bacterium]
MHAERGNESPEPPLLCDASAAAALPGARPGWYALSSAARPTRVITLIAAIALLSLADLYVTLLYLHSGGMGEANPLARWLIGFNMPALLVVWKIATVGLASGILFAFRRQRLGELGAWACCLILVWLTLRWQYYHAEVPDLTAALDIIETHGGDRWVRMGE